MQNTQQIMRILDIEKTGNYGNRNAATEAVFECAAGCGATNNDAMFFEVHGMRVCKDCATEEFREYLQRVCREQGNASVYSDVLCGIADDLSDDDIFVHLCECLRRVEA